MLGPPRGVQDRQPNRAAEIEPLRGNFAQFVVGRLGAIFPIHVQQQRCLWLIRRDRPASAQTRQQFGQRRPHHRGSPRSKTRNLSQPPVMRSDLQFLQTINIELRMQLAVATISMIAPAIDGPMPGVASSADRPPLSASSPISRSNSATMPELLHCRSSSCSSAVRILNNSYTKPSRR